MNREIKFRIWDRKAKHMLYPQGIAFYNEMEIRVLFSDCIGCMSKDDDVMQFTGLTDKDGKEIYEGDILYWDHAKSSSIVRWSLEDEDNHPGFRINNLIGQYGPNKVIGNIFENPELLNENA